MVRLKFNDNKESFDKLGGFNSTMVRLKSRIILNFKTRQKIQFHYGSIKIFTNNLIKGKIKVSIPLWFD